MCRCLALGTVVFGWDTAVIATPPLTGGLVASIMMADAATAKVLQVYQYLQF